MKSILTLIIGFMFLTVATAQHDHSRCGMTAADQESLVAFVEHYNKIKNTPGYTKRADKLNVPIKFHSVARSDGSGRMQPTLIIRHFDRLRREFAVTDMNLYLYDNSIDNLDNTSIYESPGSASAAVRNAKDPDALDIFVTENADTPSGMGTVLGFYSPANDYIIIRITDVSANTASLTHELGHMFSLPHTFNGWESQPYDEAVHGNPVTQTTAPSGSHQVELQDGSNCSSAADRICDTPPDYNFGFGANGCNWSEEIFDRNNDLIVPMFDNYMGYFIGCDSYQWTQGQIDVMRANWELNTYNNNDRSFLRSDYVPTSDTVEHEFVMVEPEQLATTDYGDYALLDWEDVPGATAYQVEIRVQGQLIATPVVTESFYELTDPSMSDGDPINWAVLPYNESYGGAPIHTGLFFLGSGAVSTDDIADYITELSINPNPVAAGNDLNISFTADENTSAKIVLHDLTGKVITEQTQEINVGKNFFQIETFTATKGLYLLKIESDKGSVYEKVIID